MKRFWFLAIPALLAGTMPAGAKPPSRPAEREVACRLGVFSGAEGRRHDQLVANLRARVHARRERADGWSFQLADDAVALRETSEWISLERRCCPFLVFRIDVDEDRGLWVTLTGPAGAKDLIAQAFPVAEAGGKR